MYHSSLSTIVLVMFVDLFRLKEQEALYNVICNEKKELFEQNEEMRRSLEKLEASEITFEHTSRNIGEGKKNSEKGSEDVLEGHQWWCYVWHEMRKQYKLGTEPRRIAAGDYDFETDEPNEMRFQVEKLKENLRQQAIEIAQLRQVRNINYITKALNFIDS